MDEKKCGYPKEWFVDDGSLEELICAVCLDVCKDVTRTNCDHIFCSFCITECVAIKDECPKCRRNDVLRKPDRILKNIISSLKVKSNKRDSENNVKTCKLDEFLNSKLFKCPICLKDVEYGSRLDHWYGPCVATLRKEKDLCKRSRYCCMIGEHDCSKTGLILNFESAIANSRSIVSETVDVTDVMFGKYGIVDKVDVSPGSPVFQFSDKLSKDIAAADVSGIQFFICLRGDREDDESALSACFIFTPRIGHAGYTIKAPQFLQSVLLCGWRRFSLAIYYMLIKK